MWRWLIPTFTLAINHRETTAGLRTIREAGHDIAHVKLGDVYRRTTEKRFDVVHIHHSLQLCNFK